MKPTGATLVLIACLAALFACSHAPEPIPPPPPSPEAEAQPRQLTLTQFVLGPGDELEVTVWRQDDLNTACRVSPLGTITMPLIGNVQAAGRNLPDIQADITTALAEYYVQPRVTVGVKSLRSVKMYVLGEVQEPGVFALDEPITALQAITMAGGFTLDAERDSVLLARGDLTSPTLRKLNLEAAVERGNFGDNAEIFRGDIIYVPSSTIADVERFFARLQGIIRPFVDFERAIIFGSQIPTGERRIVIAP